MKKIYFTKDLKLSLFSDFNIKTYNTLKSDFYNNYMKGETFFFIKSYETILTLENLKNKGFNEIISFSNIVFNLEEYDFDEPLIMNNNNKNKPNFPTIPFIAKSITYTIVDSGDTFYDLQDENNILTKITTEQIKEHKLVCHTL
ncbi:hypothetical protein H9X57_16920 [Flavobacterium piscinae]|uniref:Uncharacterized protein n=1 Tax=Flavobacterium piscinae TaxID=2506424 RepID=A0A4Q1KMC2_9FLAO|nr:hypothetical protein [Flavobacterium piscinae]MBC8884446.1 hypothetical protein [Flavobacterium piscinae]RXR30675.1 hypothetical protein EQG68_11495 [Flavobacterium piscinae]